MEKLIDLEYQLDSDNDGEEAHVQDLLRGLETGLTWEVLSKEELALLRRYGHEPSETVKSFMGWT